MTTYHEPPLQSRRAARESERAERPPLPLVDPTISVPPLVAPQPAPGTETETRELHKRRQNPRRRPAEARSRRQSTYLARQGAKEWMFHVPFTC